MAGSGAETAVVGPVEIGTAEFATADAGPPEALPSWFVVGLVGALAVVVAFGTIGLALADLGAMSPFQTVVAGAAATFLLLRKIAPRLIPAAHDRATQIPAALAVALATAATGFAMGHHAEHVLIDRDPGAYMVTARWLSTHHNLEFHARLGGFRHIRILWYTSPAIYDHGAGRIYFQFSHLLPTLLAEARWLGGDRLMFLTPPIIGGLGLLCFYALATRFVRPWLALAAMTALATDLVEVHFMRDAYSELPTQVVLLGGLWLLTRRGQVRPALAAFTGLLLGATVMARVDGPLYLVAIPLALGIAVMAARRNDPGSRATIVAARWLAGGAVLTAALGYADVALRSPGYVKSLGHRFSMQYLGLAVACLLVVGVTALAPRLVTWPARVAARWLPEAGALAVGGGLFAMWFLRPHLQTATIPFRRYTADVIAQQRFYGVVAGRVRTHSERTLVWHSWYLGPITLAVGIVGIALITREVLRGRGGPNGIVVATFLAVAAVYLWNPNILSDQLWVMRRYLPFILPVLLLGAFVVADRLFDARVEGAAQIAARAVAVAVVITAIAWPIHTDWPVRDESTQQGFLAPVKQLCHVLGRRAAVVVLAGGHVEEVLPQTLRSFCDIPVGAGSAEPSAVFPLTAATLGDLAREWAPSRRTLFVIADGVDRIDRVFPGLAPTATIDAVSTRALPRTLSGRPRHFVTERYRFVVAEVAPRTAPQGG